MVVTPEREKFRKVFELKVVRETANHLERPLIRLKKSRIEGVRFDTKCNLTRHVHIEPAAGGSGKRAVAPEYSRRLAEPEMLDADKRVYPRLIS